MSEIERQKENNIENERGTEIRYQYRYIERMRVRERERDK